MATFKFKRKVDDQINEFKEFIKGLKAANKVKIVYEMNTETTMSEMQNECRKIFDILSEDVQVEFNSTINKNLKKNENIITVDF